MAFQPSYTHQPTDIGVFFVEKLCKIDGGLSYCDSQFQDHNYKGGGQWLFFLREI